MENPNTESYIKSSNADTVTVSFAAAQTNYFNKNYTQALKIYSDLLLTNASAELYIEMGNCYFQLNNYETALEHWEKAIELEPKNSIAYSNIGNLYYKKNNLDKAISYWIVSSICKPEDATTNLNLAVAYNAKSMSRESLSYYEKYLKYEADTKSETYNQIKDKISQNYNVAVEYLNLGFKLQKQNKMDLAKKAYLKSISLYSNLYKSNLNLGSVYFIQKDYVNAVKYWKKAYLLDEKQIKVVSNLALASDLMSKFDEAYCYYSRYLNFILNDKSEFDKVNQRVYKLKIFLAKNPQLVDKHLKLAKEYFAQNNYIDAIFEFKNYIILEPQAKSEYTPIIKKLENYLNPELDLIAACFKKGNSLFSAKKYTEAKPYYARILVLSAPQYIEFNTAKSKLGICMRNE